MLRLFPERGGDPERPGKKQPLDALLWQAERPGEPAWDSVLGRGRPGWHVECSAIALDHLGDLFDVQGGGSDLVFPHHEMSASHAQAAFDDLTFARAYVHAGMVGYDGEKMSKSKGNLVLVSALREAGTDPMAIRLAILAHHYRCDWEWTDADLTRGQDRLASWRARARLGVVRRGGRSRGRRSEPPCRTTSTHPPLSPPSTPGPPRPTATAAVSHSCAPCSTPASGSCSDRIPLRRLILRAAEGPGASSCGVAGRMCGSLRRPLRGRLGSCGETTLVSFSLTRT